MNVKHHQLIPALAKLLQAQQPEAFARLQQGLQKLQENFTRKDFFYLFAICPRWFAKHIAKHETSEYQELAELDSFAVTKNWMHVQYARLYILLVVEGQLSSGDYATAVNQLFQTADVNELILLVQSLQFIPQSERFVERAREAARSNIESVFCALAHNSDYAFRNFDKAGWNQLILKAAFLAVPIWNIYGLRQRNNPELVTMLLNYVEERQAAKRVLPWDLWACVGWLATSESDFNFLSGQLNKVDAFSAAAIILGLKENEHAQARALASQLFTELGVVFSELSAEEAGEIDLQTLGWEGLAKLKKL